MGVFVFLESGFGFSFHLVSKTGTFLCLNSFRAFYIVMAPYVFYGVT